MRRIIIIGRVLLLLLAAAAVVSAFTLSRRQDHAPSSFAGPYVCPMHPAVTSRAPGHCAICRMALERVSASGRGASSGAMDPAEDTGSVAGSPSYAFPDSADLPNYKLIAGARRRVFAREVRAPAWLEPGGVVTAVLYDDEIAGLAPGEQGLFFRASAPAAGVGVRLTAEAPARWDPSTSRVRFRVVPGARALGRVRALGDAGPSAVGWVRLAAKPREVLVVPSSAVLNSPEGPYVLVASADGRTFTKRPVRTGRVVSGFAVALSGLREQERVVVGNTFFLDAERRVRSEREGIFAVTR